MVGIPIGHTFSNCPDANLRSHLSRPVPANPIAQHRQCGRLTLFIINLKMGYRKAVFVLFALHPSMAGGRNLKSCGFSLDHRIGS